MSLSIDQQVAQLAAEGCTEIAVIKLPSQAKSRKRRKPSKRRASTNPPAYVPPAPSYPTGPSPVKAIIDHKRNANRANAQYKSDRVDFIVRGSAAL